MITKFRVIANAPTVHQYDSVLFFGFPEKTFGGSYVFSQDFDTAQKAKDYLNSRIDRYWEDGGSEEECEKMRKQVESGYCDYDAVKAVINEIEIKKDEKLTL